MNNQQINQLFTNYYEIIGEDSSNKQQVINTIVETCQISPDQWSVKQQADIQAVLQEASKNLNENYIYHQWYQGVGNPVQTHIYFEGQQFNLDDFIDQKPSMDALEERLKQQRIHKLQQQKKEVEGKLNQIEKKLEQWMEEGEDD